MHPTENKNGLVGAGARWACCGRMHPPGTNVCGQMRLISALAKRKPTTMQLRGAGLRQFCDSTAFFSAIDSIN